MGGIVAAMCVWGVLGVAEPARPITVVLRLESSLGAGPEVEKAVIGQLRRHQMRATFAVGEGAGLPTSEGSRDVLREAVADGVLEAALRLGPLEGESAAKWVGRQGAALDSLAGLTGKRPEIAVIGQSHDGGGAGAGEPRIDTLALLDDLGIKLVSGGPIWPEGLPASIAGIPWTCAGADLEKAIRTARVGGAPALIVVRVTGDEMGGLDARLAWLAGQADVAVKTLGALDRDELTSERYRLYSHLRTRPAALSRYHDQLLAYPALLDLNRFQARAQTGQVLNGLARTVIGAALAIAAWLLWRAVKRREVRSSQAERSHES